MKPLHRRLLVLSLILSVLSLVRVAQSFQPEPDPDRNFTGRAKFVMDELTSKKAGTLTFKAHLLIGAPLGSNETWKVNIRLLRPEFETVVAQKDSVTVEIPKGVGKKRFEFGGEFQMLPHGDYRIAITADDQVKTDTTLDGKVVPHSHFGIGRILSVP